MFKQIHSVLCVAALGLCCSCTERQRQAVHAEPNKTLTVSAAKVTRADLSKELVLSAEFRPYQEIEVHAKVAGYLKQILVDVGDRVHAGQTLALLEIPEMQDEATHAAATKRRSEAELVRSKSELVRAQSAHEAAHLAYERLSGIVKTRPGLVAHQEIDEAQARDRITEAQVATAQAAITESEQQVQVSESSAERVRTMQAYMKITAPFAGVITKRFADTGAMIQAGTASQSQSLPVVKLSQDDRLRLVLPVPESAVPRIKLGSPVEVRVQALGRTIEGRVARFSSQVLPNTRTMETEVDVLNPRHELVPGMYAEAVLQLERKAATLVVPIQAVSGIENKPSVLLVNASGHVEQRAVTVGLETPEKVEILSGLNDGDIVIVGRPAQLQAGQKVDPKLTASAPAVSGKAK